MNVQMFNCSKVGQYSLLLNLKTDDVVKKSVRCSVFWPSPPLVNKILNLESELR